MDNKEILKAALESHHSCLECDTIEGTDIVSFGNETEPYVLNFQIKDGQIDVNIIDKDRKAVIDNYKETFETEEELTQKANDASVAYDVILSAKPEVEKKLESKEANTRRDDAVSRLNNIITGCNEFIDKWSKADVDMLSNENQFESDLKAALVNVDYHFQPLCKDILGKPLYEGMLEGEEPAEKKDNDEGNNDTIDKEKVEDALNAASVHDLLQTTIDKLNERADEEEDEMIERVVSDIAIQAEEMLDELDSMIQTD